jgi:hypothetical protein
VIRAMSAAGLLERPLDGADNTSRRQSPWKKSSVAARGNRDRVAIGSSKATATGQPSLVAPPEVDQDRALARGGQHDGLKEQLGGGRRCRSLVS